jgi:hypothetical protein
MKTQALWLVVAWLLASETGQAAPLPSADTIVRAMQAQAVARVRELGGSVISRGGPEQVWYVSLWDCPAADGDLKLLPFLPRLKILRIDHTKVSDKGLACLRGLPRLENLSLFETGVSDAGMHHLRGIPRLAELGLGRTRVTDAGLEEIGRMASLRFLDLQGARVTFSGVVRLQKALPKTSIKFWPPGGWDSRP